VSRGVPVKKLKFAFANVFTASLLEENYKVMSFPEPLCNTPNFETARKRPVISCYHPKIELKNVFETLLLAAPTNAARGAIFFIFILRSDSFADFVSVSRIL